MAPYLHNVSWKHELHDCTHNDPNLLCEEKDVRELGNDTPGRVLELAVILCLYHAYSAAFREM
jgi:hypothetical protein